MRGRKPIYGGRAVNKLRGSKTLRAARQACLSCSGDRQTRVIAAAGKGPEWSGIHWRWSHAHRVRVTLRCGRSGPMTSAREDE